MDLPEDWTSSTASALNWGGYCGFALGTQNLLVLRIYRPQCSSVRGARASPIEALLIASGQNVKRLLAFGGRKPKKLAQVAALRPPSASGHKIKCTREHRSSRSSWRSTKEFFNALGCF